MKKKIIGLVLAICLFIPCIFALSACGKDKGSDKTMSLSVNPEISFVVDGDNKIVNVLLDNEDAGTIYANVKFEGLTANEAVKIMIERSVISGHFTLTGDTVELDVNGSNEEDIKELKEIATNQINTVCNSLGIEVTVNAEELNEEARKTALIATATILAPEKTQDELKEMTFAQLVELIKEKQNALKGLAYNQVADIQEAFSMAENSILQAIKTFRDTIANAEKTIAEQEELIKNLPENMRETANQLINEQRDVINKTVDKINEKLAEYEEAKARAIENAKTQYEACKTALVTAYKNQVSSAKAGLKTHLDAKLEAGTITQSQYNYWIELSNNQAA